MVTTRVAIRCRVSPVRPRWGGPGRRVAWRRLSVLLGAVVLAASTVAAIPPRPAAAALTWAPVYDHDFPDPAVLVSAGTYYAYSTESGLADVPTATSPDGVHWTAGPDAMPVLAPWAEWGKTWAPSVAQDASGQYVMFYAATDQQLGIQCIGRAVSSSPGGPFVDDSTAPVLCNGGPGGDIDPDVFTGPSGQSYLLWKNDGNASGDQIAIWSEPLDAQLQLTGVPTPLLSPDAPWQGGIVEGPDMVAADGTYYLFYSAGSWSSSSYSIGYATCGSPSGPCSDHTAGPVLTSGYGMSGPGGEDVFANPGAGGALDMAFAAWPGPVGYGAGGYRALYLAGLTFVDGFPVVTPAPDVAAGTGGSPAGTGYREVAADGGLFSFGGAPFAGSMGGRPLNAPVVGMAATPDGSGYWEVAADGGVFAFGDAGYFGSAVGQSTAGQVVGIAPTANGGGYWEVSTSGQVSAFGDAAHLSPTPEIFPQGVSPPVVGIAADPATGGYWVAYADGVVDAADAPFFGAPASLPHLNQPIVGIAATPDGGGYWLVAADGGIFAYGDARFSGSMGGRPLNRPIVGLAPTPDGNGYWEVAADGGIFAFGDAGFAGSMGGRPLNQPVVAIT